MRRRLLVAGCAVAALSAGCGDDPQTATGGELPLVDGATVVQRFEEANGIVEATVLFQVVTRAGTASGRELLRAQRVFLESAGWSLERDRHVPATWVADSEESHDFIRLGRPGPMKRAAMGAQAQAQLTADPETLARSIVVQTSPPGPPQPE